jgi:hypothetical protein
MGGVSVMENIFAIISDGQVKNVIVADLKFVESLNEQAIDVTNMPNRPGPGWLYDGENFSEPIRVEPQQKLEPAVVEPEPDSAAIKSLRLMDMEKIPTDGEELKQLLKNIIEAIL